MAWASKFQRQVRDFLTIASSNKVSPTDSSTTDNQKWHDGRQSCNLGSRSLSKSFGSSFIELVIIENPEFVVGISTLYVIVPFPVFAVIDISDCRELPVYYTHLSLNITSSSSLFKPRFSVGILTLPFIVSDFSSKYFRFLPPFAIVGHCCDRLGSLPVMVECRRFAVGILVIYVIVP